MDDLHGHDHDDIVPTPTERRMMAAFDAVFASEEPIPDDLVRVAQDLYTWRTVDAELLELLVDSAETELAVVRDDDRMQRFVAFGNDDHGVHFECTTQDGDTFLLTGIVVPAAVYAVRVDRPGADLETMTDDLGSFTVGPLDAGSIRLTIRAVDAGQPAEADGGLMVTPWFMLQS